MANDNGKQKWEVALAADPSLKALAALTRKHFVER